MPCREELPLLVGVARQFQRDGGRLLGVSFDLVETKDAAKAKRRVERVFAKADVGEFTTVLYRGEDRSGVLELLKLPPGIPQTVAIDAAGEIVDRESGVADTERLAALAAIALGK